MMNQAGDPDEQYQTIHFDNVVSTDAGRDARDGHQIRGVFQLPNHHIQLEPDREQAAGNRIHKRPERPFRSARLGGRAG